MGGGCYFNLVERDQSSRVGPGVCGTITKEKFSTEPYPIDDEICRAH